MKLATIMIIIQAILLLASLAAFGFMMYSIKTDNGAQKTGAQIWESYKILAFIIAGVHGLSLVVHGLSTFWCRGR